MKTTFFYVLMGILLCGFALTQERKITGKITDTDDGSPIPGVSVILKGSRNGTSTDGDGRYSITLPSSGGTLIFSFIGYTTKEVRIGKEDVINVRLSPEVMMLREEVVTGNDSQAKS